LLVDHVRFPLRISFRTDTDCTCSPETKNRTLEELDDIFNSPNPRNASLVKKKIAADNHGNILEIEKI